ncbi:hypothetical protein ACQ4PT_013862 [Festuca glaucescens]
MLRGEQEEEFQEADILWPADAAQDLELAHMATTAAKAPALQAGFSKFSASLAGAGGSSLMIGSQVFVPPHVIVDRRAKRDKAMLMLVDVPKGRVRAMAMLQ